MTLKNSTIIVGVTFVESEEKHTASAGRVYQYFVPQVIVDAGFEPKRGNFVLVPGGDGRPCLGRIDHYLDTNLPIPPGFSAKATKAILGTVDNSHHLRHQQQINRRNEIMRALIEMDERRKERLRFDELARDNAEAGRLLTELDSLDKA